MSIALWAATACLLTMSGVAAFKRSARRRHWLDHPNERSSHSEPTPRGGGLPMIVVLGTTSFAAAAASGINPRPWLPIAAAGLLIAVVSWIDDLRPLPTWLRLGVHLAAAITVASIFKGFQKIALPGIGTLTLGVAGAAVAVLWIAGLTNAYNFMDGIDGIAGVQAVMAGAGWAIVGWMTGAEDLLLVGAITSAAAIGFLFHNWNPASIFMGDVGSASLGFLFSAMTVAASSRDGRFVPVGILLVWPFIFDSGFTLLRRIRRGEKITQAHRSHLYQRLTQAGLSHRTVAGLYAVLDASGIAAAIALLRSSSGAMAAYVTIPMLALALWTLVWRLECRQHPA